MITLLNVLLSSLLLAGVYFILSLGLNIILGVLDIVNFAHGALIILGAYSTYFLHSHLALDPSTPGTPAGGELVAEIDVFGGALDGLVLVEVEFDDLPAAERFAPPDWFGRELTDDARWSGAALARRLGDGSPPLPS